MTGSRIFSHRTLRSGLSSRTSRWNAWWRRHSRLLIVGWLLMLLAAITLWAPVSVHGADIEECRAAWLHGRYDECIRLAAAEMKRPQANPEWAVLKAQAELTTGQVAAALQTTEAALQQHPASIRLRLMSSWALKADGRPEAAHRRLLEIDDLARRTPWRYTETEDLVALGETVLMLGGDPRDVQEEFFRRANRSDPDHRAPWLAMASLARETNDLDAVAEIVQQAVRRLPDDPDILFGVALSCARKDRRRYEQSLQRCLELNPRHVEALMVQCHELIDADRYDRAGAKLKGVLAINPRHPDALGLLAVVAHLRNDPRGEAIYRDAAIARAGASPLVDHLIGRKLSEKYRFREGAAMQRRALATDDAFLPARIQLAQDLLRLGEEAEGWKLAEQAHQQDQHDMLAANLLELKERIAQFTTLRDEHFILRMETKEAAVYGQRVLRVLNRAKQTLCRKYELDLTTPIIVEIFPDEDDFAVRTFGMPDASGYLGVCFGKVITANSPASRPGFPANWESVLWHEFCHVVTLELTHNRLPRWLSEGISVYEESQENPAWGQRMNPRFRRAILSGELHPVSQLSTAFLTADSPEQVQFVYYESSLVVEYLVGRWGFETLRAILAEVGRGLTLNDALVRHTASLPQLDEEFAEFARHRAESLAPEADWSIPETPVISSEEPEALRAWLVDHPDNLHGLARYAEQLIEGERFEQAKAPLKRLLRLFPEDISANCAAVSLAHVHRQLGEKADERKLLAEYARRDPAAVPIFERLIDIAHEDADWPAVMQYSRMAIGVNPMRGDLQRILAEAAERCDEPDTAIEAWRAVLQLDPDNPAEANYRLARLLHQQQDPLAWRHVFHALEQTPRVRTASRLLREIRFR